MYDYIMEGFFGGFYAKLLIAILVWVVLRLITCWGVFWEFFYVRLHTSFWV